MITYKIDKEQMTPFEDVLESLEQQSHALRTIHNPKTWCLSALTFALHLNDCLVLFEDMKERWSQNLPFDEAWDVKFNEWKNRIWTAANEIGSSVDDSWRSLCDTDYNRFIALSHKFVEGEIPLTPLLSFIEGHDSNITRIITDVGRKLSKLFTDIEGMLTESQPKLYEDLYDACVDAYVEDNSEDLYKLRLSNGSWQAYKTWASSKKLEKLAESIDKQIDNLDKDIREIKTWAEVWDENYDKNSKKIDHEGIARHIFVNRFDIISNKQYPIASSMNKLLYTVMMIEFLKAKIDETKILVEGRTDEQKEEKLRSTNTVFNTTVNNRNVNFVKLQAYIKEIFVDGIKFKYEWAAMYKILLESNLLREDNMKAFANMMVKSEWYSYLEDRKKCSADSVGDFSFLLQLRRSQWDDADIPVGSKATDKGMRRVISKYDDLKDDFDINRVLNEP